MRKRVEVKAVWDSDLEALLQDVGLLETITLGNGACAVCDTPVDLDNLGAVIPQPESTAVTCDNVRCVRSVTAAGKATA